MQDGGKFKIYIVRNAKLHECQVPRFYIYSKLKLNYKKNYESKQSMIIRTVYSMYTIDIQLLEDPMVLEQTQLALIGKPSFMAL